jgi:hypothetical protein
VLALLVSSPDLALSSLLIDVGSRLFKLILCCDEEGAKDSIVF